MIQAMFQLEFRRSIRKENEAKRQNQQKAYMLLTNKAMAAMPKFVRKQLSRFLSLMQRKKCCMKIAESLTRIKKLQWRE
ncbi:MAG: hypothetical protein EZS28_042547 [Streblomastix strix]|uniref:Uncharacterized protein n=1 Tax=Streblomastix strix TaxID=222440 RepID=A0A5J4TUI2_9EUKA|nr:MAG: hypothetical protein EZS28_042547 [Streblomastix strix]